MNSVLMDNPSHLIALDRISRIPLPRQDIWLPLVGEFIELAMSEGEIVFDYKAGFDRVAYRSSSRLSDEKASALSIQFVNDDDMKQSKRDDWNHLLRYGGHGIVRIPLTTLMGDVASLVFEKLAPHDAGVHIILCGLDASESTDMIRVKRSDFPIPLFDGKEIWRYAVNEGKPDGSRLGELDYGPTCSCACGLIRDLEFDAEQWEYTA